MPLSVFHPLTRRWFQKRFSAPTEPQLLGWPAIAQGQDTLLAAPTGSGKTLAAFLSGLDRLLRLALDGQLQDRTYLLYVSPLRALSNDIQRNLQVPLAELLALAREEFPSCPEIRALVRTGDTSSADRQRMVKHPPHILVTTPESLYLLLTGPKSRDILRDVATVIVDEIHALARDKRGSHLALSLERLEELNRDRPQRIGLSATQKPMDEIARFLTGVGAPSQESCSGAGSRSPLPQPGARDAPSEAGADCLLLCRARVIDTGHMRQLDLALEIPRQELQAVCSHEQWGEIYERLVALIREHHSTLIFVNTRRLAERVSRQLSERLGADAVSSHHGSLAHELRQRTEQRLKQGSLKAVVATASLELGINIGHIDLVCQIGTPRSIATLLQRIGRAGHSLGVVPKGRLFALTRDELLECLALVRAVYAGRLDRVEIPVAPLDILAQQLVAAVACEEWDEDALFALCRRAYPYRDLARADYEQVLEMLSAGIAPGHGRRGAYLHRDQVGRKLRARRGARLTAVTCGGAIPEIASYRVVAEGEGTEAGRTVVGTVDEDFAVESMAGDIFLLGNTSWRIRYVRGGEVVVADAHGAPPTIPFWLGEAPGRTAELSAEVANLRQELVERVDDPESAGRWLQEAGHVRPEGAEQAVAYVAAQQAATGMVPTQKRLLFERFFDESGGMQLVIHAPFGTRINRAWGLALRKRFCRSFNFELQAAAGDNGIVLSLGPQHSFPLDQMFHLIQEKTAREILIQALLAVPFFTTRWRWNVTRALAVRRMEGGRRVPPPLQRFRADDLLSAVFPMQTACLENIVGDIEVPDHPLVRQTMHDCLREATDLEGWLQVLKSIEEGALELVGLDTREPSPFSHELLNANPYAFLDDAPLEERRARAVSLRRTLPLEALRDLGRLDPEAIAQVRTEAWPIVRDADELHDALLSLVVLLPEEGQPWRSFFEELRAAGRATLAERTDAPPLWVATERWPLVHALWPAATARPEVTVPYGVRAHWEEEEAAVELVRGRLESSGPATTAALFQLLGLPAAVVFRALLALEAQGSVLRGRFTHVIDPHARGAPVSSANGAGDGEDVEWCERRLLARIHRLTLEGLRRQIEPVPPENYIRFLLRHQHLQPGSRLRGQAGLLEAIAQLEGFALPARDWERYSLFARVEDYDPAWLDALTLTGQVVWGRLCPTRRAEDRARPIKALTRSVPLSLMLRQDLSWLLPPEREGRAARGVERERNGTPEQRGLFSETDARVGSLLAHLGGNARAVYEMLCTRGALFIGQLTSLLQTTPGELKDSLGELAAAGLITCDGFAALRGLIGSSRKRVRRRGRASARPGQASLDGGRWSLLGDLAQDKVAPAERLENWCRLLLRRYGVLFRDLLARESASPPWHELVRTLRTLEARGDIRGGRFVAQVAGEQYALPESIDRLRRLKDDPAGGKMLVLTATDPVNLFGRIVPGPKVPAAPGNCLAIDQGRMLAHRIGAAVTFATPIVADEVRLMIEHALRQGGIPARRLKAEPVNDRRKTGG